MTRPGSALLALALLATIGPAWAEGPPAPPVTKGAERFDGAAQDGWYGGGWYGRGPAGPPGHVGLPTRWDGGPGYVGSDWGLGRPANTGLGSRPDWGRSNLD